jgi:hypothetical protein
MGNVTNSFVSAIEACLLTNYIPIDQFTNSLRDKTDIEKELIKKDTFLSLSKDAISIIDCILTGGEILPTPITNQITKRTVSLYLQQNKKWKQRRIEKVFNEMGVFVKSF